MNTFLKTDVFLIHLLHCVVEVLGVILGKGDFSRKQYKHKANTYSSSNTKVGYSYWNNIYREAHIHTCTNLSCYGHTPLQQC